MSSFEIPLIRKWLADLARFPDDASRLIYLEIQSGHDPRLKDRTWKEWLRTQSKKGSMDDSPSGSGEILVNDSEDSSNSENPSQLKEPYLIQTGQLIGGKYQIMEMIGEGGMGEIYRVQQIHPVKMETGLALKLIKSGLDSRKVLARFRAERTAIGLMDHPNIAKIHDAGTTVTGNPFFVMELVDGEPITTFCDKHRLNLYERLDLFIKVCDAIQHAHQKGVIHRDIKPGNILVKMDQGRPVPKVIDFGVAKALWAKSDGELESRLTSFATIIGTPEYMSPEQADTNHQDVDTRTDVYSLGVLLFELFTGFTPLDRRLTAKTGVLEMLTLVREKEVPVPSWKLSTEFSLSKVAEDRSTDPNKLQQMIKGELDWIMLKALEKDRNRRYESPGAFARDIQRYLNDEVVEARPPGKIYQAKKFVRRYKIQVTAAVLVVLALVGGVIGTTLGMIEARKAEAKESEAKKIAEIRAIQVENALGIVSDIFKNLNPNDLENTGKTLDELVKEKLDTAIAQIEKSTVGTEIEKAFLLENLANAQKGLGNPKRAIAVLEGVLMTFVKEKGPDDPITLECMDFLGRAYFLNEEPEKAIALVKDAWEKRIKVLGEDHADTKETQGHLGLAYRKNKDLDLALNTLAEVVDYYTVNRGEADKKTLYWLTELGVTLFEKGDLKGSQNILEYAYFKQEKILDKNNSNYLLSASTLSLVYKTKGDNKKFLEFSEKGYVGYKEKLPDDHRFTLRNQVNFAEANKNNGKLDVSLALFSDAYFKNLKKYKQNDSDTLLAMLNYGLICLELKEYKKGFSLAEEAIDKITNHEKMDKSILILPRFQMAKHYRSQMDYKKMIACLRSNLDAIKKEKKYAQQEKLVESFLERAISEDKIASDYLIDAAKKLNKFLEKTKQSGIFSIIWCRPDSVKK